MKEKFLSCKQYFNAERSFHLIFGGEKFDPVQMYQQVHIFPQSTFLYRKKEGSIKRHSYEKKCPFPDQ